jgi:molecular chaperone DnaK
VTSKSKIMAAASALFLATSTIASLAQTGGGTGGGAGSAGSTGGASGTTSGGTTTAPAPVAPGPSTGTGAAGTTTDSGRVGPGSVPVAPGPSGSTVPSQRVGPGGAPIAPGPAGDIGGTQTPSTQQGAASGSTVPRPDCVPDRSRTDTAGLGRTPTIMVEPGQTGPSLDSRAGTTGRARTTESVGTSGAPGTSGTSSTVTRTPGC